MKSKDIFKPPFYKCFDKVFCDNHKMAFDFMIKDKLLQLTILNILNGGYEFDDLPKCKYVDGKIFMKSKDNEMKPIILIRGWGYLTGVGGLKLSSEKALKIQDYFGNWIIEKLNKK